MRKKIHYKPGKPQATMGFIVGLLFILIGLVVVIPSLTFAGPFGALFGLTWTAIAVYNTVLNGKYLFGKKAEDENLFGGYEITEDPAAPQPEEHDHIPSTALDPGRRLEQLKNLLDAGLLTKEEYDAKRKEILRDL